MCGGGENCIHNTMYFFCYWILTPSSNSFQIHSSTSWPLCFLKIIYSNLCCSYSHHYGAISWHMIHLSSTILQRKLTSPLPKCHQLSAGVPTGMGVHEILASFHSRRLAGLIFCWFCADNHSFCEFTRAAVLKAIWLVFPDFWLLQSSMFP